MVIYGAYNHFNFRTVICHDFRKYFFISAKGDLLTVCTIVITAFDGMYVLNLNNSDNQAGAPMTFFSSPCPP